ncbi:MAG: type I methionyl aminopeptidase [Firmicutes bacterium]|jgi:methionyl aminopeptidase|nr:type I methionyl aminopeptidase [Bacillota bacterium]
MIISKTREELDIMREAGRIVARVLQAMKAMAVPGVETAELDQRAREIIKEAGAEPAFLGYRGFPASICTSINEELVHGIPGTRKLKEGDILSVDAGARFRGYHGDAAVTLPVGKINKAARRLVRVTEGALEKAIEQMRIGNHLSDVSHAIQSYVESFGFSVVRNYVGHGIGTRMHEPPEVPNFGLPGRGPRLREGMVLAIEPMVNIGSWEVEVLADQWTVVTADRSLCAHFEHSVAITSAGPEILTLL